MHATITTPTLTAVRACRRRVGWKTGLLTAAFLFTIAPTMVPPAGASGAVGGPSVARSYPDWPAGFLPDDAVAACTTPVCANTVDVSVGFLPDEAAAAAPGSYEWVA